MLLDEFPDGHAYGELPQPWFPDPAADPVKFCTAVIACAQGSEPIRPVIYDVWYVRDRLDVVHDRGLAEEAADLWKRRFGTRRGPPSFERIQEGRFLTTDITSCASMYTEVEIIS